MVESSALVAIIFEEPGWRQLAEQTVRTSVRQTIAQVEPAPAGAEFLAPHDGKRNCVSPIVPDLDRQARGDVEDDAVGLRRFESTLADNCKRRFEDVETGGESGRSGFSRVDRDASYAETVRRKAAKPRPAKPRTIITHVDGSATLPTDIGSKLASLPRLSPSPLT